MSPRFHPGITSFMAFGLGLTLTILQDLSPEVTGSLVQSLIYGASGWALLAIISKTVGDDRQFPQAQLCPYQVDIRAFFLGWSFSCGFRLVTSGFSFPLGSYIMLLSLFHYSEFFVTSYTSPETLTLDSFLLNHSREYAFAAFASLVEFFIEFYFFPGLKQLTMVSYCGLFWCFLGELLRKAAMFTASTNFTHLVRDNKAEGQYLVTTGPYAIFRHPGYAGWYWWSVGTQLVMINPVCAVGYCFAAYKFFKGRIYYEEICLLSFFGLDYVEYQKNVPRTGVPFVKGYLPPTELSGDDEGSFVMPNDSSDSSEELSTDDNFHKVERDQIDDDA